MADLKISELTNLTAADPANDMIPIVDVSATPPASGSTKRISINNILACSPTATLASATISGDLTVDTSTLKVDSANNRVGVVQATPLYPLDVTGTVDGTAVAARLAYGVGGSVYSAFRFENTSFSGGNSEIRNYVNGATGTGSDLAFFTTQTGGSTLTERYRLDVSGVATWSNVGGVAGTAMTLNSTGLGVGVSPTKKLEIVGTASATVEIAKIGATSGPYVGIGTEGTNYSWIQAFGGKPLQINPQGNDTILNPSSGNVGIGVTPSALTNVTRLEIGGQLSSNVTLRSTSTSSSARNWMVGANMNSFGDFVIRQGNSQGAEPNSGTDRLVIDLNGNPIFTPSSTPATLTTNGQLTVNATSNTNLRFSYRGSDGVTRVANITLA